MKKTFYLTLFIAGMIAVFIGASLKVSTQEGIVINIMLSFGIILEIIAFIAYAITRYKSA